MEYITSSQHNITETLPRNGFLEIENLKEINRLT
jgi:hypothetical protein